MPAARALREGLRGPQNGEDAAGAAQRRIAGEDTGNCESKTLNKGFRLSCECGFINVGCSGGRFSCRLAGGRCAGWLVAFLSFWGQRGTTAPNKWLALVNCLALM